MNPTKVAATYCRVSTSAQEEQQTIKNQINSVQELSQLKDIPIVKEYIDDGWSGDMLARPGLDKLRQDAKKKIFQVVFIYDPDRLARRYSYQELVMDELKEAGIEVIFCTIDAPKNSEDKILYGVRGLFAEYERAKISERFRLGKLRKVREGHVLTTEAPYGYNYIRKQDTVHGYYEIHPEEARIVRMMFSWVADDGLTLRKIVRKLQELDIKPRKSKRGVWSTSTLTSLFKNKAYIGEAHWGTSYAVVPENPIKKDKYRKNKKSSRKMKPESEWYTIPVPPLIDKDLFFRTRDRLDYNFKLCQKNTKNEYLLVNKIWCTCGKRRGGEGPQHGKHLYYRCNDRVTSFPLLPDCKERGINARIADKLVWEKVKDLMSSPELLLNQIERWFNNQKVNAANQSGLTVDDLNVIEKQIVKLKDEEDRYYKAYGTGLLPEEKLKEYTLQIREKIKSLKLQFDKSKEKEVQLNATTPPSENDIRTFAQRAIETLDNLSFLAKRAIVLSIIEKVIGSQQTLQVYGFIPITTANNNVEFCSNNRNGQNTIRYISSSDKTGMIPFELTIMLPSPLQRGIDYGFKPAKYHPK